MIFNFLEYISEKKTDILSGVVLLVDDKILLVKPKKFKSKQNRWSIPKGHIEKGGSLKTAFMELEEETGISFPNEVLKINDYGRLFYKKNKVKKKLNYYVLRFESDELNLDLRRNGELPKKYFKGSEIFKVKLMDKSEALKKIEPFQVELLDYI